jgi:hypothetical protein
MEAGIREAAEVSDALRPDAVHQTPIPGDDKLWPEAPADEMAGMTPASRSAR